MDASNLLIVDPSLTNTVGHHFEYAKSVRDEALRRGIRVDVLCHQTVTSEVRESIAAIPIFRYRMYDWIVRWKLFPSFGKRLNTLLWICYFMRDWIGCVEKVSLSSRTLVFLPTCTEGTAFGFLLWLRLRRRSMRPKCICLFRYDPRPTIPFVGWFVRGLVRERTLMLATDSEELAKDFLLRTGLVFHSLPIPHLRLTLDGINHYSQGRKVIEIAYLGDARLDKGIDILVGAIPSLVTRLKDGSLRLVIQCNILMRTQEHLRILNKLKVLCDEYSPSIRLVLDSLTSAEYHRLLLGADAIILPYRQGTYRARTSGIFAEALAVAKPVVVTEGTWMAAQLDRYGAGVQFTDGDPEDLARAVERLMDDYEVLQSKASCTADSWNNQNSAMKLLDDILSYWR